MNESFLQALGLTPLIVSSCDHEYKVPLWLNANTNEEARERLLVYQNNIRSSLSQALLDTYPVCSQIVGEDYFNALSLEFIAHHLPNSPILSQYGKEMSQFISEFPPLAGLPFLSEVAYVEYELLMQTIQKEIPVLSFEEIQIKLSNIGAPEESLWSITDRFKLWHSQYSSASLYLAHQPNSEITLSTIDWQKDEYVLFTKIGVWGHCYLLEPNTYIVLQKLSQGELLGSACEGIQEQAWISTLSQLMSLPIFTNIIPG